MRAELWICMEHADAAEKGILYHLRALVKNGGTIVSAVLPYECGAEDVFSSGAQKIYRLPKLRDERQKAEQIAALCKERHPDVLLFPATVAGRCVAAMGAAELSTGLSADCTGLALQEDNLLVQTRPAFGGTLLADIVCEKSRPQIATVRPGVFLREGTFSETGALIDVPRIPCDFFTELLESAATERASLTSAGIVISGGKGIGAPRGFQKLKKLAGLVGGAVGASRAAVGAGYAAYEHQVGLTGCTIRPEVYVAVGISGAIQHLVGMEHSKTIVAVNSDENAPIFGYADFAVVSGWEQVIDALIEKMEKVRL
jgi:electron transfer flavoprotein alpha subunit